jgi:diguanylate cyclase (GGDEF)-like protein
MDSAQEPGRDVCCSMTSVLLRLVRSSGGEGLVHELLERSGSMREPAYLEDADNWASQDEVAALLQNAVELTGDPAFAMRVGEETVTQHAGKQVATLLRSLGSVEAVLQAVALTAGKLTTTTELEAIDVAPGRATVRAQAREGFTRTVQNCELTTGLLRGTPSLFGLPGAQVHQSECQARGDAQCLYTVTWDAELAEEAADPQQRVTALEAQLKATSERLHSVYAIASDLVSTEDLDTVLRRIVERAADTVRAPSHILAVRPGEHAELQVYSRGIGSQEARALAERTLAGAPTPGDSTLVVEVDSGRRRYGQLIARFPGKIEFFAQDSEMLSLYAKHAAAVLDMALALQESDRRHEQVSSLLALSHALANAGTSIEVAERLAAAAPDVVDCDRMRVWLWDGYAGCLRSTAAWPPAPIGTPDELGLHAAQRSDAQLTISPSDTPDVERMLGDPQPLFFDESTEDPFTRQLMAALGVVALTVVPIVARDVFLGVLTVAVTERPERLRPEEDLMQRLTGVAALAAPAMQNGLLVDQLRYKASHDGLTGLLNRVGFRQCIDNALKGVGTTDGRVGLLFVDLNGFKQVNDLHGHDAGDELIRQAAARLSAVCRGEDEVARLGGDEFAIVLAAVHTDEQVHAAERRVREAFNEPFQVDDLMIAVGASVGGGVWPDNGHTVSELVRHADAAMYEDKAQSRRASINARQLRATR